EHGVRVGQGEMVAVVMARASATDGAAGPSAPRSGADPARQSMPSIDDEIGIGRLLSAIEDGAFSDAELALLRKGWANPRAGQSPGDTQARPAAPVIGITGTGGAGKSSVTDELLNRFLAHFPKMRIAVISVDPTRRRTGGALLGDRIRMNSLRSHRVYMRSMATRRQNVA